MVYTTIADTYPDRGAAAQARETVQAAIATGVPALGPRTVPGGTRSTRRAS
ncbi:MAG: hypothetical protein M5U09_22660 [Gammaproteobacteria bacterium]|nr:hypothetical protein [Gammaproteobacteria bacterium]